MHEDLVRIGGSAQFCVGLGLLDDDLHRSPCDLAFPRGECARSRRGGVFGGRGPDRLRHTLSGRGCRLFAEVDGACNLAVGDLLREELRVGELTDVVGLVGDHREPLHAEAEVHHRHADPVLRKRRRRVDAECGDLNPAEDRVPGVDLRLGVRHVVLRPFFVGLEPELGKPERREEGLADGLSLFEGDVLPRDDAGGRVIGHQAGGALFLLPPETAVHREEPDREVASLPEGRERQEPAARHMAPEGVARRLGSERPEFWEDRVKDVHHGRVVGLEDAREFVRQVVAVDRSLLVAVEGHAEILLGRGRDRPPEDRLDLLYLLLCYPDVRTGQAAEVEDPVEDGHRFRAELPVNIGLLNYQRVHRLVEPHREVGLPEPLHDLKDRVRGGPGVLQPGVAARNPRRGQYRRAFMPGMLEILSRLFLELFHVKFHTFRSRQTTRLTGLSSLTT